MKNLFRKIGFRKADEMEMSIQLKSIKWAWVYTVVFLFIWSLYELLRVKSLEQPYNGLPLILLISQNVILSSLNLYLRHKMGGIIKGEDDEE